MSTLEDLRVCNVGAATYSQTYPISNIPYILTLQIFESTLYIEYAVWEHVQIFKSQCPRAFTTEKSIYRARLRIWEYATWEQLQILKRTLYFVFYTVNALGPVCRGELDRCLFMRRFNFIFIFLAVCCGEHDRRQTSLHE